MRNRKFAYWLIVVCLPAFIACGTFRRQTSETRHSVVQDSTSATFGRDSRYSRLLQASSLIELRLRHIALSPPDSLGRQYPQSVTLAEATTSYDLSRRDTLARQSSVSIRTDRITAATLATTSKQQASGHLLPLAILLLIALALAAIYFKKHF